ncbi:DNA ligase (ATP) [Clydaea vesicula]|uniref:DNA ligase n=1 Tax=Clydaea vesicula TaxID=447962 RepID=A0AAD5U6V0_9FUNG|nr:DNA ligase (ATP) [Clydaea vesicula]
MTDDNSAKPQLDSLITFSHIVNLFQTLEKKKGKKQDVLIGFHQFWKKRDKHSQTYPYIRLLCPSSDRERNTYGLKELTLAKSSSVGSFSNSLYDILSNRCVVQHGTITISDVNKKLDELCLNQERESQEEVLRYFYMNCTAEEQKWIVRIILKDLKIGISADTVLTHYHPDALEQFNVTNDLKKVAVELMDYDVRVPAPQISLFNAFTPMLSQKTSIDDVLKAMKGNTFWVETKLDGERIQMHKDGSNYQWFSRKSHSYTYLYGSHESEGALCNLIHKSFRNEVKNCILDGEMLALNTETGRFLPFGNLKTAALDAKANGLNAKLRPFFRVFDCLFLNGKCIMESPLEKRYGFMLKIFEPQKNIFDVVPHAEGNTVEDVIRLLDESMLKLEEGIIIKNPLSLYKPSSRGEDWLKLKADYMDSIGDNLDLLIVGGSWGEGRRGGKLSNFLLAVFDEDRKKFISVGKCGSGYNYQELDEILRVTEGKWKPYNAKNPPSWLIHDYDNKNREKPGIPILKLTEKLFSLKDMVISPEHSKIVEVLCAEIVVTDMYECNFTLRFPRFVKLREDKGPDDCLTFLQLKEIIRHTRGKLRSRTAKSLHEESIRKKRVIAPRTVIGVSVENLAVNVKEIEKIGIIFKNLEFCVLADGIEFKLNDKFQTKHDVERVIIANGGNVVQNPVSTTNFVVSDKLTVRVNNLISGKRFDVIRTNYIYNCLNAGEVIQLNSRYLLFATDFTKAKLNSIADKYGDLYEEQLTESSLKELFFSMDMTSIEKKYRESEEFQYRGLKKKRRKTILEIEERYFGLTPNPGGLFRRVVAYLDSSTTIKVSPNFIQENFCDDKVSLISPEDESYLHLENKRDSDLEISRLILLSKGASVVDVWCEDVTHLILDDDIESTTLDRFLKILTSLKDRHERRPHIVYKNWIKDCCYNETLLPEENYRPRSSAIS